MEIHPPRKVKSLQMDDYEAEYPLRGGSIPGAFNGSGRLPSEAHAGYAGSGITFDDYSEDSDADEWFEPVGGGVFREPWLRVPAEW